MLKDAIKKYLDIYADNYKKYFGTYPTVDAEITEKPSICFVGEENADGYIQWRYKEQPKPTDFKPIETQYDIAISNEVKQLYNSYLFMELQGFRGNQHVYINPVTDETAAEDILLSCLEESEAPYLIEIGIYGDMDLALCIDLESGEVYTYDYDSEKAVFLVDSLTELISQLSPMKI